MSLVFMEGCLYVTSVHGRLCMSLVFMEGFLYTINIHGRLSLCH